MVVFFKFEEEFYRQAGVAVTWIGHPLVEAARPTLSPEQARERFGLNPARRTVGLLPGSRTHEIARHLPLMLAAARRIAWQMPGVQFLVPKAPAVERQRLEAALTQAGIDGCVAEASIYDALQLMEAAIVTSGTATLETALCGVPMVVVYRTSWPTYLAARAVVRIPQIALVNVIAGSAIVPEFLQHRARPRRIAKAVIELLRNEERNTRMKEALHTVKERLGPVGAVDRAAEVVLEQLRAAAGRSSARSR
jgi:lipid-A-disaccharide synthase